MSRIEAEKIGAVTVMKQKLFRVSTVLGTRGAIAAAVLSGGVTEAVVATGKTTGWAFLSDGTAYQRVGATAWKKVELPAATAT